MRTTYYRSRKKKKKKKKKTRCRMYLKTTPDMPSYSKDFGDNKYDEAGNINGASQYN